MSYVPEIFCENVDDADRLLKVTTLYFDHVRMNTGALVVPYWIVHATRKVDDRFEAIFQGHDPGLVLVDGFAAQYRPLVSAGVVREVAYPHDDEGFISVVADFKRKGGDTARFLMNHAGIQPGTEQARDFEYRLFDVVAPMIFLMLRSEGVVTCANPAMQTMIEGLYTSLGRRFGLHPDAPPPPTHRRARQQRDRLATAVLQLCLPNVADLHFEQVLELRHRQHDNLLRFRAKMGDLSKDAPDDPDDVQEHILRVIEQDVAPALADLRRQQEELRRSSVLSYVGSLSEKAQLAVATLGAFGTTVGAAVAGPVGGAAGLATGTVFGVAASAVHAYRDHQAKRQALIAGSPFTLLVDVPTTTLPKKTG